MTSFGPDADVVARAVRRFAGRPIALPGGGGTRETLDGIIPRRTDI